MLYIHNLNDLNRKSADIEATALARDLKRVNSLPLSEDKIKDQFSVFFVSKTDLDAISQALDQLPVVINEISQLSKGNAAIYEIINLQRSCVNLQELPIALTKSLDYAQSISEWQDSFVPEVTALLNSIPSLKTVSDKKAFDVKLSAIFGKLLRNNKDFAFYFSDIVSEAQVSRVKTVSDGMAEGFFFRVELEEHLKKHDFNMISKRIPINELEKANAIGAKVSDIKRGVERAYDINMRMISFAVTLYAFIKWIK